MHKSVHAQERQRGVAVIAAMAKCCIAATATTMRVCSYSMQLQLQRAAGELTVEAGKGVEEAVSAATEAGAAQEGTQRQQRTMPEELGEAWPGASSAHAGMGASRRRK